MDYVVGSVAALITGNVTPNRPRLLKRALTPTKHQPSPNVTPKSEFVEDRSIFLSPSMQKKKAMVKKSPKRIFQNPDLETTESSDGNLSLSSPKADKVKKHLKEDLEVDSTLNKSRTKLKSPKNKIDIKTESTQESTKSVTETNENESTPKKKKNKLNSQSEIAENVNTHSTDNVSIEDTTATNRSKKKKQRRKSIVNTDSNKENDSSEKVTDPEIPSVNYEGPDKQKNKSSNLEVTHNNNEIIETGSNKKSKKKNKKRKKKSKAPGTVDILESKIDASEETIKVRLQQENQSKQKNKNKMGKRTKKQLNKPEIMETDEHSLVETEVVNTKAKSAVNPNAITDKESDSEHESDNEIESENEEINKKVLESEKHEESSDEEDEKVEKKEVHNNEVSGIENNSEDEIKRTLFIGNVPFSAKCKKEIKKIFNKHGQIETIRIRTVPIKDGRYTPKLAVIKNELHPERTTVNVYIKYTDADSVEKALVENNTLLNENHLRVSRSSSTGAEHDPRCSVFIGNLPFAMEDEALRAKFENCGEIHSVRIIRDKKTNAGKGFGYVNFASKDGVELALALTEEDLTVKNRILRVKRCTQLTNKKKPAATGNNQVNQQRGGFRNGNNQGYPQRGEFRSGNNQGNQQRGEFRTGNNRIHQQRDGVPSRHNQGNRQRGGFAAGNNQTNQLRGGFNKFSNQRNQPQKDEEGREGAHRRIMHKRKNQDGLDGPPNKRQKDINQPIKEKKSRKEFVGMTAEKKKKRKFDKGQKKKKVLSEILTK